MDEILNSMKKSLGDYLTNWQMQGYNKTVDKCLELMERFESIGNTEPYRKNRSDNSYGLVYCDKVEDDVKNWFFGFLKAQKCKNILFLKRYHDKQFDYLDGETKHKENQCFVYFVSDRKEG